MNIYKKLTQHITTSMYHVRIREVKSLKRALALLPETCCGVLAGYCNVAHGFWFMLHSLSFENT